LIIIKSIRIVSKYNDEGDMMNENDHTEELLNFFKALADQNRLKIIGILAEAPHTVEDIADLLGVSSSTASHHLSKLTKAGLVSAAPQGHYYQYSLHTDVLQEMSQRILSSEVLPTLHKNISPMNFEEKVLKTFLDEDGKITTFPKSEKKFSVIIHHVFKAFEPARMYSGKEVDEILSGFSDDTASIRRAFIEYRLMERSKDGTQYWVIEK
jgi:biotin operon repressor